MSQNSMLEDQQNANGLVAIAKTNPNVFLVSLPKNSVDWLIRLISFNTVSQRSNLALIEEVQAYCVALGLEPMLTFNDQKTKANLFVTVSAKSSGNYCDNDKKFSVNNISNEMSTKLSSQHTNVLTGGIVLSGHTDVVPVEGQDWTSNPFIADIRDNKLYGRGACDMKGFIACALAMLPKAVEYSKQGRLVKPLHLALSFDEEVGCLGAPLLLNEINKRGIKPDYCIVGEPSMMNMVVAHKGISVYKCSVHGKSVHSSLTPQGVNAISYASQLIGFIDKLAAKLENSTSKDTLFDVPFSTLSVGTIKGGTATNIVPNLCQFTFDYRNLPDKSENEILEPINAKITELNKQMQQIDSDTGIKIERLESVPAMTDSDSKDLQALIAGLVEESSRHKVAYATEGGQFTNAGIATVICGPGSIEQAHKPDEFVALSQLKKCDKFLEKVLHTLTA